MSVHLDSHAHHVHFTPSETVTQPRFAYQRRFSYGEGLDIRSNGTSCWDCIKKCFQAIWEFIQRLFSKTPLKAHQITMDDVDNIVISDNCAETHPCQHRATLFLKGGRNVTGLTAHEICSIVNRIPKDRINITNNPENPWTGDAVIKHFQEYANAAPAAEEVLNRIFLRKG